jgi:calcineurin-like phosphoesterase family protein/2'-5' RNA ligase
MGKPHYLVEYRFRGYPKSYVNGLIYDVAKKFGVTGVARKRPVPHMTLFGPFTTKDEKRMVSEITSVSENYDFVPFKLRGFVGIEKNNVVAVGIEPSEELKNLRRDIAERLQPITNDYPPHDRNKDFIFHATVAFKDVDDKKFDAIWNYLKRKEAPKFKQHVLRVTVLKRQKILCEYDLMQGRLLNRRQALDEKQWEKTRDTYFRKVGIYAPETNVFDKLKDSITRALNKNRIFLISDTHLDHDNIIKYCDRPFKSRWGMNIRILKNWNNIVKNSDIVYFLGDLSFGRESHPTNYWHDKIKGKIVFIKGSHDISKRIKFYKNRILKYKGRKFFLAHDPEHAPEDWDGWIIHGHHHNNDLRNFPFINGKRRTINVSAELINYTPISIDKILDLDIDRIEKMYTIDSAPRR